MKGGFHHALSTDFIQVLLPEQSESVRGLTAGPALRRHTEPRTEDQTVSRLGGGGTEEKASLGCSREDQLMGR